MSDRLADLITRSSKWPAPVRDRIAKAPKVICDELAATYWQGKAHWDLRTDTGPLRLPYPKLWVEWRSPSRVENLVEGDGGERPSAQQGVMITEFDLETHPMMKRGLALGVPEVSQLAKGTRWLWFDHWMQTSGAVGPRRPTVAPDHVKTIIATDDVGTYVTHVHFVDPPLPAGHPLTADYYENMGYAICADWPAVLALSFMNCKNVEMSEPMPGTARRPRTGRGCPKPMKYRRIIIPGGRARGTGGGGGTNAPAEVHMVRGHFKTYTEDAPLMGAHTGTYWWGHHVRGAGDDDPGTPEYEVKAS